MGNMLVTHSLHSPSFPSCGNKIAAIHPFSRALRVKVGNQKARFLVALSEVFRGAHSRKPLFYGKRGV
jgi:hypothetical protein